jgi:hypothetical protein
MLRSCAERNLQVNAPAQSRWAAAVAAVAVEHKLFDFVKNHKQIKKS